MTKIEIVLNTCSNFILNRDLSIYLNWCKGGGDAIYTYVYIYVTNI